MAHVFNPLGTSPGYDVGTAWNEPQAVPPTGGLQTWGTAPAPYENYDASTPDETPVEAPVDAGPTAPSVYQHPGSYATLPYAPTSSPSFPQNAVASAPAPDYAPYVIGGMIVLGALVILFARRS